MNSEIKIYPITANEYISTLRWLMCDLEYKLYVFKNPHVLRLIIELHKKKVYNNTQHPNTIAFKLLINCHEYYIMGICCPSTIRIYSINPIDLSQLRIILEECILEEL